ncbi:MAG TPA: tyrosine-type recombinase/integrase [Gammaproteobacteria bacterium]|nr:tyrosine-type recombinase/integrase [Gammaproteobacteria bacterium]
MTEITGTSRDDLRRLEATLVERRDELSRVLVRSRRRSVTQAQYDELLEWATWLDITRGLSPNTSGNYIDAASAFLAWLNSESVAVPDVTSAVITRWQQHLYLEHGQAAHTQHVKLTAVRRYFRWRSEMTGAQNPAASISSPRKPSRVPRKYSEGQLQAMFGACDRETPLGRRDFAVLLFLLSTGARREEVVSLSIDQMELREKIGAVRFFGKGAKERIVSFEGSVVRVMQEWLAERESIGPVDPDAVFVSVSGPTKGRRLLRSGFEGIIERAIKRGRVRVEQGMAVHTMRATFATALYDSGCDIEQIRIILGHEDINTTRQYIAISDRQMQVRLPRAFTDRVTGAAAGEPPLWFRAKKNQRHGRPSGEQE